MSQYKHGSNKIGYERLMSIVLLLLVISSFSVSSQNDRRSRRNRQRTEIAQDTVQISDSVRAVRDSVARADSISRTDSLSLLSKSSIDRPAFSAAKDSIIEDFTDGRRMMYYYGDVQIRRYGAYR